MFALATILLCSNSISIIPFCNYQQVENVGYLLRLLFTHPFYKMYRNINTRRGEKMTFRFKIYDEQFLLLNLKFSVKICTHCANHRQKLSMITVETARYREHMTIRMKKVNVIYCSLFDFKICSR